MKDVSQCLLSIIDEFDKYHSKIISLEDEKQAYDKKVELLKISRDKLLQGKQDNIADLENRVKASDDVQKEFEKISAKYKYVSKIINEPRDENAHMNAEVLRLEEENKKYLQRVKILTSERDAVKEEEHKPKNISHLFMKINKLEEELKTSKKHYAHIIKLEDENEVLKKRYKEMAEDKMFKNAQHHTLHELYLKIQKQRNNAYEKVKNLEYEYEGLNKLYQHALHEKQILQKKTETLTIEKYNKMYESKTVFGIDMGSSNGSNAFVDIDSLIDGIGSCDNTQDMKLLV